jgi:hypothetical protein
VPIEEEEEYFNMTRSKLRDRSLTLVSVEISALKAFRRMIARRIYIPIREEESWRIRANKGTQGILQGTDIVRFKKSL